jgi:hypothetical protein
MHTSSRRICGMLLESVLTALSWLENEVRFLHECSVSLCPLGRYPQVDEQSSA